MLVAMGEVSTGVLSEQRRKILQPLRCSLPPVSGFILHCIAMLIKSLRESVAHRATSERTIRNT